MKKVLIILTAILITGVLFAVDIVDSTDFYMSTTIEEKGAVKIGDKGKTSNSVSTFNSIDSVGTSDDPILFDDDRLEAEFTVYTMINKQGSYSVGVKASPLSATGVSTKINYTVAYGTSSTETVNSDNKTFTILSGTNSGGLIFPKQDFKITLDNTTYTNASAGEYSTSWTIELTSN